MKRTWQVWLVFAAALAALLFAMGWVSVVALRLDRAEAQARRQAVLEENVRLALWRTDSALMPLIATESARPYFTYGAFYAAGPAHTRKFARIEPGEVLIPSPLLTEDSPYVLLHFQVRSDGTVSSPQAPTGRLRELAASGYATREKIEHAAARLAELEKLLDRDSLLAALPREELQPARPVLMPMIAEAGNRALRPEEQAARNVTEWQARANAYQQIVDNNTATVRLQVPSGDVAYGALTPLWVGEALVLARQVVVGGEVRVQGCRLDWPGLRKDLAESIEDLLPSARLESVLSAPGNGHGRMLASLPVELVPGPLPFDLQQGLSPIRLSLLIAWACVLAATGAVAVLLQGVMSLSERRGAFVSAVTHELRTPLTTFRMYAEMLAEGMVPDEGKRRAYLNTLRAEADRLHHLVENVLSYARLEKGRRASRLEPVGLGQLLDRAQGRLADRARSAGMRLDVEAEPDALALKVRADASAVEQILFNLVDNACKYAASAREPVIHLEARRDGRFAAVAVRDRGPGISGKDARAVFLPFRKSARDAANSAPGVGLGLALSRRLAREMGGDLRVDKAIADGARLVLTLPLG